MDGVVAAQTEPLGEMARSACESSVYPDQRQLSLK